MSETIISPPRTIMEVFKMLPENTLAEVIENTLFMSPAPTPFHQRIVKNLSFKIDEFVQKNEGGEVFISPIDVYLDEVSSVIQPDIVFFSASDALVIDKNGVHGVPQLVIEVLSSGNQSHDLITKKNLYQKFGVREYWVVDQLTKECIGFFLKDGSYSESSKTIGKLHSLVLEQSFSF